MAKKAFIIVGVIAAVAIAGGVVAATNFNSPAHKRGADSDPATVSTTVESATQISSETAAFSEATEIQTENATLAPTDTETEGANGYDTGSVVPTASFSISRVVDVNSGEEVSPRLVFGNYANYCNLTLYSDNTLSLCLNPTTEAGETGTYSIYDNTMYVFFEGDREARYPVIFSDEEGIDTVIVNYSDYEIYFS